MFEQSILADPPKGRKNTALCASLLAQIAICGVLLLVPLVYTDAITFVPDWEQHLAIPVQSPPPPPEPEVQRTASQPTRRTPGRIWVPSRPLQAPTSIPDRAVIIVDSRAGDPTLPDTIVGVPISASPNGVPVVLAPPPEARIVEPAKPDPPAGPVHITSTLQAAKLISKVVPAYPTLAKQTRTQGVVKMRAIIGRDGKVRDLQVTEGHPFLRQAAVDAVQQWVYSPTILGNQAVEVDTIIEVNFVLN